MVKVGDRVRRETLAHNAGEKPALIVETRYVTELREEEIGGGYPLHNEYLYCDAEMRDGHLTVEMEEREEGRYVVAVDGEQTTYENYHEAFMALPVLTTRPDHEEVLSVTITTSEDGE